jgi:hypothetical protein
MLIIKNELFRLLALIRTPHVYLEPRRAVPQLVIQHRGLALFLPRILFLLLLIFTSRLAQASPLRIPLLSSAEVQTDAIVLANLLPPGASPLLRSTAQKISLGAAPQTGSTRVLSGEIVGEAVTRTGFSRESFLIPESITVRRSSRFLTRDDVFAAIQLALAMNPQPQLATLTPDDLFFDSSIRVPDMGVSLKVTQIVYDEFIDRVRFRIQPKITSGILPFFVTAPVRLAEINTPASYSIVNAALFSLNSADAALPLLVDPRHLARLHLHSPNFDGLLDVRPLQRGHLGEIIRVRLPYTGKTLQVRVIAAGSLDAAL